MGAPRPAASPAGTAVALPGRPRLRGVVHAGAVPPTLAAGIVLTALAPAGGARLAVAVYSLAACALFATSAVYHLGPWTGRARARLAAADRVNIHLIIAGTYTPFAVIALDGAWRAAILGVVWGAAAGGVLLHLAWPGAPRLLATPLYVAMGWIAVLALPELLAGAGTAPVVLAVVGGVLYTLGALVYLTRRPDPVPHVLGFHEVFHILTVAAFAVQYVGVSLVAYAAA